MPEIIDPDGVAERLEKRGLAVALTEVESSVPTMLYGFAISVRFGPYPMDAPRSHRRAVYAIFTPVEDPGATLCRRLREDRVLAQIPLSAEGARVIASDPNGTVAERAGKDAIAAGVAEIRRHLG